MVEDSQDMVYRCAAPACSLGLGAVSLLTASERAPAPARVEPGEERWKACGYAVAVVGLALVNTLFSVHVGRAGTMPSWVGTLTQQGFLCSFVMGLDSGTVERPHATLGSLYRRRPAY